MSSPRGSTPSICHNDLVDPYGISLSQMTMYMFHFKKKNGAIKYRYIEEEQTIHWNREKAQQDKQRSTKHIHKTKDRVTRTSLKTVGEIR
jgi:hypothetical protein